MTAEQCRAFARECRSRAQRATSDAERAVLLNLARQLEKTARLLEGSDVTDHHRPRETARKSDGKGEPA
jgi:hypothetical protein